MSYSFRKATLNETPQIWEILKDAIARRKRDGSDQWQNGYPSVTSIEMDIAKDTAYVLIDGDTIIGYCAVLVNDEPEYANIKGKWLTNGDFVVYHRVAISENYLGRGLAQKMLRCIEDIAIAKNIKSIKADTNYDNIGMLRIFEKLGYAYCGEVTFRGSSRKAFEKVLE
jgi:GNAT superfamily N-acetyltransferase